jgi:hypothetical protein
MTTAASGNRPLAAPTASAVVPVLFLVAIAGGCWAVTAERMRGMDMGPRHGPRRARLVRRRLGDDDGRDAFAAKATH